MKGEINDADLRRMIEILDSQPVPETARYIQVTGCGCILSEADGGGCPRMDSGTCHFLDVIRIEVNNG